MVTCHVRYVLDPYKIADFEEYASIWVELVRKMGGTHHGYFLPGEGANNIAICLFSFPSLADYERYRRDVMVEPDYKRADEIAQRSRCIQSYDRTFMRPLELLSG
ncbi:NIPSNAP family protein [Microvirga solisilvae]|uniref:NIPSNAP family protein n=1 Tax=Microvirga solisilvae TaxID=2919498 RepID=UPI001FAEA235|nr:NIPSNAP family protein [Microvirga solisilvae]